MPHQCVRCGKLHPDGAEDILKGCSCGAKLFMFVKQKHLDESKELVSNLTKEDKDQIEKDVTEILQVKNEDKSKPVVLDFETIRILKPGKYELDLIGLFRKDPLVFKLAEGKYFIDLPQAFKNEKDEE